jgi:hypothetical protein
MFPADSFKTARCPSEFGVDRGKLGEDTTIDIQITDRDHCEVPLNENWRPVYLMREMYWSCSLYEAEGVIVDAATGQVTITIPATKLRKPGIYLGEIVIYNEEGGREVSMFRYLEIAPTLEYTSYGPITIPEIRLVMWDECPDDNTLLDDVEFSDLQIVHAIRRPIDLWNETSPNVRRYTPQSFPFREHWMICTVGFLMRMAAHHYRRNNMTYNAGGQAINDKDKAPGYEQIANARISEFKEWMKNKKIEINFDGGYATFGSAYGYRIT